MHIKWCFIILVGLFFVEKATVAQTADSLLTVIKTAKQDTVKLAAYEQLAIYYRRANKDSAYYYHNKAIDIAGVIKSSASLANAHREYALTAQANDDYEMANRYYQKALDIHKKADDKKGMGLSYNDIGIAYYYAGNFEKAREFFEKSGIIKLEVKDSIGAGQAFNNTGIMDDIAGNPTGALKLYLKALNIYENAKDTNLVIGTLSNIGLIYIGQKNYNEALKLYARQKKLAEKVNNKRAYGVALASEGTALDHLGKYLEARTHFLGALEVFTALPDKQLVSQAYNNLSVNYELTNEDDLALDYALKSISIKKEIGNEGKLAVSLIAAAKVYHKKGQHQRAIDVYKEALENAVKTGYMEYAIKAHQGLSQSYFKTKQFEKAYYHQSLYVTYSDSVTNKENTKLINELEKRFQSERKEQEIELLNKTSALKDVELGKANEESKRKSIQLLGSFAVGVILLVFGIVVFRNNQQKRKSNQVLTQKNEEITRQREYADEQRTLVEEKNKEILDSIQYAKRIQTAMLPPQKIVKSYLEESFILYKPKDIVSGDFYWLEVVGEKVFFAAADCTGHGVPGALVSVMCSNALTKAVKELSIHEPAKILDKVSSILEERFEKSEEEVMDGMDIALCCLTHSELQYSGANNPLWLIRKEEEQAKIIEIKADKQPIGKHEGRKPYTNHKISLRENDSIYIFSDGFVDQFGGVKGKKFKSSAFKELLLSIQEKNMQEQKQVIDQVFENWKGKLEQVDDVCVIGVRK